MRLKDKVAIVTGAANGIGAIPRTFAREGCHVVLADLDEGKAAALAEEIMKETGVRTVAVGCDVAQKEALQRVVDTCVAEFGTVDILVNNAGITLPACPVEDITPERWRKVLDIDLMGTIYGTQCVIPVMKAHKSGKIINMASVAGQVGGVFTEATYPVSKAGVICWAKAVAKQVGEYNITCNCIAPGTILTAMTETLGSADASLNVPLHRLGSVKDVAGAALFLASDESDFITGATINVNGGMSMIEETAALFRKESIYMDMYEKRVRLRELMAAPECVPVLGAYDLLSAKLIEATGFPVVYTGSFITGASQFFLADVGLVQLKDLLPLAYEIAKEVDLPLICDVDNGWFHSGNIWRTVHEFEAAGASGIQVEDGIIGKHVSTGPIDMSKEIMVDHIHAMCEARKDKNFVIIARTDALWLKNDLEETIDRCNAYLDAGADACFITFPGSIRGMKEWRHRIHGPVVTTPIKYEDSIDQETEAGACMSVYWPNTIYAAFTAVRDTLKKFAETRDMTKVDAKFDEDELLKLLPLQKYYDQMDKYHGEKQYLK